MRQGAYLPFLLPFYLPFYQCLSFQKFTIMKAKKAIIVAMAAATGMTMAKAKEAAAAANKDMREEFGNVICVNEDPFCLSWTWDPTDGECA